MKSYCRQLWLLFFTVTLLLFFTGCSRQIQDFSPEPQQTGASTTPPPVPTPTPVSDIVWTDTAFEAIVRQTLMKSEGDVVMRKELQEITSLSLLTGVSDLTDLKYFDHLEELHVRPAYPLEHPMDLSPIGRLKRLERLDVSLYGDGYDLSFLRELPQLTALTIQWPSKGEDISAISSLSNLTVLGLMEIEGLDLSRLSGMVQLTELYLKFCDVTSLEPLEDLVNLRVLALQDSQGLGSLSPIGGMKSLEFLDLTGCLMVESLEPLRSLEKLTEVFIAINPELDLSPLSHVKYINGQPN